MNGLEGLLATLQRREVRLWAEGDALRYTAPAGALDDALRDELRQRKAALLAFLRQAERATDPTRAPRFTPAPRDREPPLSFAQERLWFLDRMDGPSAVYNIAAARWLRGPLSSVALEQAMAAMVRRHESLRTTFAGRGDRAVQVIAPAPAAPLARVDLRTLAAASRRAVAERLAAVEAHRPFDLVAGPLLRTTLLQVGLDEHLLLTTMHHAIADGWSNTILLRETGAFHDSWRAGTPASLPGLRLQYADYAIRQREWLTEEVAADHLRFWRQALAGAPPLLELPADRPRPPRLSYRGGVTGVALDRRLTRSVRELARRCDASLFMVLLAGFAALLARISGRRDLVLGIVNANRPHQELEPLIGFFVDNLPLRVQLGGDPSFAELVTAARDRTLDAFAHQDLPFHRLVEALQPARSLGHAPLYQVGFVLQSTPSTELELAGIAVEPLPLDRATAKYDLSLLLWEAEGTLVGELEYSRDLFDRDRIERLAAAYPRLLAAAVADPGRRLSALPLISPEERRLLERWARPDEAAARGHLWTLLARQSGRQPDAVALTSGEEQVTYGELAGRALRLATRLRALGVHEGEVVAVGGERSVELVVGVLGILAAGAAYLPLEPSHPAERLAFMLRDASVRWVLAHAALAARLAGAPAQVVPLAGESKLGARAAGGPGAGSRDPRQLAYVIYTSGSSGQPKGVMIEHRSVVNLVAGLDRLVYRHHPGRRRVALVASLIFDASVQQLFAGLLGGHRVQLVPSELRQDPARLLDLLAERQVEIADCTPSLLALLDGVGLATRPGLALTHLLVGGEALPSALVAGLAAAAMPLAVTNVYGPTECCVDATAARLDPARLSSGPVAPIGRPLPGHRVRIVDSRCELSPIGVPGEVVIAGAGVGRGYLRQPALTAGRFRPDPFGGDGGRLYRSGDRGRWSPRGEIEFLGRDDEQVKIRGHRIELGEVAAALRRCPGVADCVVLPRRREDGWSELVAYLVAAPGAAPEPGSLRAALEAMLPGPMIPAHFAVLDRLPLNASGKVDRARLPAPAAALPRAADPGPRDERETSLAEVWAAVLGLGVVGVEQSFFELGGDSIKALQVVARLRQRGVHLELHEVFAHPTIAGLAPRLSGGVLRREEPPAAGGVVPLTPIQRWFLGTFGGKPGHYVQSLLLAPADATQPLAPRALAVAWAAVQARHDAFRLRFRCEDGRWVQVQEPAAAPAALEQVDLRAEDDPAAALLAHGTATQGSFDLARGPLVRAVLYRLPQGQRLLLTAHHLVVDAVSWRVVLEELAPAYQQARAGRPVELPAAGDSFAAWAHRLAAVAEAGLPPGEAAYWQQAVAAAEDPLPTDFAAGSGTYGERRQLSFELDPAVTTALLGEAHRAYRTQANDLLLTAVARALGSWRGCRRTRLLLEGHGREPLAGGDASHAVGWFTTLFPVTLDLGPAADVGSQIQAIQATLRRVPRRGLGFGLCSLAGVADASPPLPAIAFNYLGRFGDELAGSPFRLADEPIGPAIDPEAPLLQPLELVAAVVAGRFRMQVLYSGRQFREATVAALARACREQLEEVVRHAVGRPPSGLTVADIDYDAFGPGELADFLESL